MNDLPHSARSVTDLENGRIYLPPASIPGGHGLRSMALQAMAHRLLGHQRPTDYADFLAAAARDQLLRRGVPHAAKRHRSRSCTQAKTDRNLAVEDFRDAFGVTHEAAAMRFTNLATEHLDIPLHFLRVGRRRAPSRACTRTTACRCPTDVTGSIEGQIVCRQC